MAQAITCLVADDHPAVVEAVCDVLEEHGIEIVVRAKDGEDAIAKIEAHAPAVALLDLRMPRLNGIEIARRAQRAAPATAIMLYTGYGDRAHLVEALDAGARGFILKEAPLVDLVRAVELVAAGKTYVDPVLAGSFARTDPNDRLHVLTQRERDVLRLLGQGRSNKEIGAELFITERTARTYVSNILGKLGLASRTQAALWAVEHKLAE